MVYKSDDKHLKISVRMFLDDLEEGLQLYTGNEKFDVTKADSASLYSTLGSYVSENLSVRIKNKEVELHYLGGEVEDGVMWCYLEKVKQKPFDEITVTNRLLSKAFDDQENLVHVRRDGTVRSLRMRGDELTQSAEWD